MRWVLLLVPLSLLALRADALEGKATEVQLKSAFLYKFTHYAGWPAEAMGAPGAPIAMCVIGRDSLAAVLEDAVRDRRSRNRPLVVKRIAGTESLTDCHLLFIGWSEEEKVDRVLGKLAQQPTLTVGDVKGFARRGGMINLTRDGNRLRFEINRRAVERAGLHLSSQLLKLAELVEDESGAED